MCEEIKTTIVWRKTVGRKNWKRSALKTEKCFQTDWRWPANRSSLAQRVRPCMAAFISAVKPSLLHWSMWTWRKCRNRKLTASSCPRNTRGQLKKIHNTTHEIWDVNPLTRPLLPYGYGYKAAYARLVKPSFVIFDIQALWRSMLSVRVSGCQKLQMTA